MASVSIVSRSAPLLGILFPDVDAPMAPTLLLKTDTSNGGLMTSDGTIETVGVETEAGTKVEYLVASGPGSTGTWTTELPVFTIDGKYTLFVRQTDVAGNVSDISDKFVFTLDTTAPAIPTVTLTFDADDGTVDGSTAKDGFSVSGNTADDIVEYSLDGTDWTTTAPDHLVNGDYTLHVRLKDLAGNIARALPLIFNINKAIPDGPDNPTISQETDSGTDATDGITNIIPAIVTDSLPEDARLQFQVKGTTAWVDELSAADFAGDGDYTIVVRVINDNGSFSTITEEVNFTLDTTVAALVVTLTNGTPANGAATLTETPTFEFADGETGAIVEFSTDNGAHWQTIDTLGELKAGDYTMIFHQIDIAGNTSADSDTVSFKLASDSPPDVTSRGDGHDVGNGHDGCGAGLSGSDFGW